MPNFPSTQANSTPAGELAGERAGSCLSVGGCVGRDLQLVLDSLLRLLSREAWENCCFFGWEDQILRPAVPHRPGIAENPRHTTLFHGVDTRIQFIFDESIPFPPKWHPHSYLQSRGETPRLLFKRPQGSDSPRCNPRSPSPWSW